MHGAGALQPTTYDRGLCGMCAWNATACLTAAPQRLGRPQEGWLGQERAAQMGYNVVDRSTRCSTGPFITMTE